MPRFRVLSDPAEQLAAYQSDRRSKPVLMPREVPRTPDGPVTKLSSVEPPGQLSENRARPGLHAHRRAGLGDKWRALARKSAEPLRAAGPRRIAERLRLFHDMVNELVHDENRCHSIRHLIMRWSLGAVFAWFAMQQLHDPDPWTHFVPSFLPEVAGLRDAALIRLHGSLLLLSSVGFLPAYACGSLPALRPPSWCRSSRRCR
jgi:hypothetical protein